MVSSRVYVVNDGGHDITSAGQYGEFVYLTKGNVNIFATDRLLLDIRAKLEGFDAANDYILLCGSSILCAIVVKIVAEMNTSFNILLYNCKSLNYVARRL